MSRIDVVAGVIEKEGKILIAKRKARRNLESKWEFPGGKMKKGETPEECLIREIKEEMDLEIRVLSLISSRKHKLPSGEEIHLHAYFAEYLSGSPKLTDHVEARWVERDNLLNYDFFEPDLFIVKDLLGKE